MIYSFIDMTQHLRLDSEGGIFFYGIALLLYLTATMLGVFVGSLMWGLGISKVRNSRPIKRLEIIFQKFLIVISGLWLCFVTYRLVVTNL